MAKVYSQEGSESSGDERSLKGDGEPSYPESLAVSNRLRGFCRVGSETERRLSMHKCWIK